ncbi:hypothetical protein D9M69_715710 [compost metagenome]
MFAEVGFRAAGRRAVVVGEVEVSNAQIKRGVQQGALGVQVRAVAEVVPQAQRDRGQSQAAVSAGPVGHAVVAGGGGGVHGGSPFCWTVTNSHSTQ